MICALIAQTEQKPLNLRARKTAILRISTFESILPICLIDTFGDWERPKNQDLEFLTALIELVSPNYPKTRGFGTKF